MNFEEMKYIFLVLINQFNINEFQKFMTWLEKLVADYKESGSIARYKFDLQTNCNKCNNNSSCTSTSSPSNDLNDFDYSKRKVENGTNELNEQVAKKFRMKNVSSHSVDDNQGLYSNSVNILQNQIFNNNNNRFKQSSNSLIFNNPATSACTTNDNNELELNEIKKEIDDDIPLTDQVINEWRGNYAEINNNIGVETTTSNSISTQIYTKRPKGINSIQKAELEKLFVNKKYISSEERTELSERLNLTQVQIKDWFKNHRKLMRRSIEQKKMNNIPMKDEYNNDS